MATYFTELADYIVEHVDWITKTWVEAIQLQPDIEASNDLTYRQVVDHLPFLCHDLADRLRNTGHAAAPTQNEHARTHGVHRWEQGYRLDEVIRESGIIRHVFAVEVVNAFAKGMPAVDTNTGVEAATVIHRFFDDMLIASAQQFAAEKENALTASERNRQAILDSALDAIIVFGADDQIREFNPAAERMFGYKREAAIGRDFAESILPAELRPPHREALANYLASGEGALLGKRLELQVQRAGGRSALSVELAITASPAGPDPVFTAYLRDLSDRRENERARQRLVAIIESSDDAIISKDLEGTITSWNEGARRLFGYTADETIGRSITMLIPPERLDEEPGILQKIRRGERIAHYETIRQRKDGTLFNLSLTVSPIKDDSGNVVGVSKIARDITERVQHDKWREAQYAIATLTSADAPLAETAAQILETIATTGPWVLGALWLRQSDDTLTCYTTWSVPSVDGEEFESATRLHVFHREQGIPGQVLHSGKPRWVHDVNSEPQFARREAATAAELRGSLAFPLTAASGTNGVIELFSQSTISPSDGLLRLVDALGIQVGLYVERKHTEDELHRQKDTAEAANQAKDRFLAALSHELRTPLTPVLMWACATAEDERLPEEVREDIRMVCRNVELEARLIDDLLDLTRITQGKLQLKLQPSDVNVLFEHAVEIIRSQLTAKNLKLSLELTAANHRILGDPTRIQQVFWNLLKNAQKFTPENGEIRVRSFNATLNVLTLEISDTGRGIDPGLMPKLFTAFQQGTSDGGLGLGLAICKAIVQSHGGKISAHSNGPGLGATFTVELSTVPGQGVGGVESDAPATNRWRKLRILMVEDHEHTAIVMSRLLRRSGHDVTVANTVGAALEVLRFSPFDLLVSDLGLPDGNGFQVMRELAKRSQAKGIAVSGYGMDEDLAQSSAAGFSAHLTKPISPEQLEKTIEEVTRG